MTPRINQLCENITDAKQELWNEIMSEMDKVARKHHVDKMVFGLTTTIHRKGKEISLQLIEDLEGIYLDNINAGGFQALWSDKEGWH